jgi:hypothetical protein
MMTSLAAAGIQSAVRSYSKRELLHGRIRYFYFNDSREIWEEYWFGSWHMEYATHMECQTVYIIARGSNLDCQDTYSKL